MKFSVVIPCHGKHIPFLKRSLESIACQVVLPHEVLVSASGLTAFPNFKPLLDELETQEFPFGFKIFRHDHRLNPGQNRQYAAGKSTGDVIVGHDADDVMHLQKIKLLEEAFRLYNPVAIIHNYRIIHQEPDENWWKRYNGDPPLSLKTRKPLWIKNLRDVGPAAGAVPTPDVRFTHGHVVYRKSALKHVSWNNMRTAEDKYFLLALWKRYKKLLYIPLNLIVYREFLSTGKS